MRELTLHTAKVLDKVRELNKVMVITRHGRLAGFIEPLATQAPGLLLAFAVNRGLLSIPSEDGHTVTSDEMRASVEDPRGEQQDNSAPQQVGVATSQELSQRPREVMDRVGNGEHLIVTRHGRPLVMLHPFSEQVVSRLLSEVPEFVGTSDDHMRDGVGYGIPTSLMSALTD